MPQATSPQFSGPPMVAGANIAPNVFIMKSTTTANTAIQATANANVIGCTGSATSISEGLPGYSASVAIESGDPVPADWLGSVCLVTAGAAVSLASPYFGYVEANSSGYAVNSSAAGTHNYAGQALVAAAAQGEIIPVWLTPKTQTI